MIKHQSNCECLKIDTLNKHGARGNRLQLLIFSIETSVYHFDLIMPILRAYYIRSLKYLFLVTTFHIKMHFDDKEGGGLEFDNEVMII